MCQGRMVYGIFFLWVEILCPVLFVYWNIKKALKPKNLKTFSKNLGLFQPWV